MGTSYIEIELTVQEQMKAYKKSLAASAYPDYDKINTIDTLLGQLQKARKQYKDGNALDQQNLDDACKKIKENNQIPTPIKDLEDLIESAIKKVHQPKMQKNEEQRKAQYLKERKKIIKHFLLLLLACKKENIELEDLYEDIIWLTPLFPVNEPALSAFSQRDLRLLANGQASEKEKKLIALSNGCVYDKKALTHYLMSQPAPPKKLPGSDFKIDSQDLERLYKPLRKKIVKRNLLFAMLGSATLFCTAVVLTTMSLAPTVSAMVAAALMVSAAVGLGLTLGFGLLVILLPLAITAIATYIYVRHKYTVPSANLCAIPVPSREVKPGTGTLDFNASQAYAESDTDYTTKILHKKATLKEDYLNHSSTTKSYKLFADEPKGKGKELLTPTTALSPSIAPRSQRLTSESSSSLPPFWAGQQAITHTAEDHLVAEKNTGRKLITALS